MDNYFKEKLPIIKENHDTIMILIITFIFRLARRQLFGC